MGQINNNTSDNHLLERCGQKSSKQRHHVHKDYGMKCNTASASTPREIIEPEEKRLFILKQKENFQTPKKHIYVSSMDLFSSLFNGVFVISLQLFSWQNDLVLTRIFIGAVIAGKAHKNAFGHSLAVLLTHLPFSIYT